jgi:hypothetical protein
MNSNTYFNRQQHVASVIASIQAEDDRFKTFLSGEVFKAETNMLANRTIRDRKARIAALKTRVAELQTEAHEVVEMAAAEATDLMVVETLLRHRVERQNAIRRAIAATASIAFMAAVLLSAAF